MSSLENFGGQLAEDFVTLDDLLKRVAMQPDVTPNSADVSEVNRILDRWNDVLPEEGGVPRGNSRILYNYINNLERDLVSSAPATSSQASRALQFILGTNTGTTPADANKVFSISGPDVKSALTYASTAGDVAINNAGNRLAEVTDKLVAKAPAALVSGQDIPEVVSVRALNDLLLSKADNATLLLSTVRSADSSVTCIRRRLRKAFFSDVSTPQEQSFRGDYRPGVIAQNGLGADDRPWDDVAAVINGTWIAYSSEDDDGGYVICHTQSTGGGAVPDNFTNSFAKLDLDQGFMRWEFRVDRQNITIGGAVLPGVITGYGPSAGAYATALALDLELDDISLLGVSAANNVTQSLKKISDDGITAIYECGVYIPAAGTYVFSLLGFALNAVDPDLLAPIKWKVVDYQAQGQTSHAVKATASSWATGDISSLIGGSNYEDISYILSDPGVEALLGTVQRYNSYLKSTGQEGFGSMLKNVFYAVRPAADTYVPSLDGGEFLDLGWYLMETDLISSGTKKRIYCHFQRYLRTMCYVSSADDVYCSNAGSC
jgi:hypothetical protein